MVVVTQPTTSFASAQHIVLDDVSQDPRFAEEAAQKTGYVPKGLMCVPLIHQEEPLGVLYVRARLGRVRLWLARRFVLPIVAALYRHDVPEIDRLFGSDALLAGMKRADLGVLRRYHPDPVAADPMFSALGVASSMSMSMRLAA